MNLIAAFVDGVAVGIVALVLVDDYQHNREVARTGAAVADVQARLDAAHAKVDAMLAKHRGDK